MPDLSGILGTVGSIFGPIGTVVGGVVGSVVDTVKDGYDKRQQMKQAEFDAKMKLITTAAEVKAQMMINQQQGDVAWENIHAGKDFWGKDAWTAIFMVPFVLMFYPDAQPVIRSGIAAISELPTWYTTLVGSSVAVSFSIKKLADVMSLKKGAVFEAPLVSQQDVEALNKVQ